MVVTSPFVITASLIPSLFLEINLSYYHNQGDNMDTAARELGLGVS
jgi:hypothetical protein